MNLNGFTDIYRRGGREALVVAVESFSASVRAAMVLEIQSLSAGAPSDEHASGQHAVADVAKFGPASSLP
jgi:hypothetical protein